MSPVPQSSHSSIRSKKDRTISERNRSFNCIGDSYDQVTISSAHGPPSNYTFICPDAPPSSGNHFIRSPDAAEPSAQDDPSPEPKAAGGLRTKKLSFLKKKMRWLLQNHAKSGPEANQRPQLPDSEKPDQDIPAKREASWLPSNFRDGIDLNQSFASRSITGRGASSLRHFGGRPRNVSNASHAATIAMGSSNHSNITLDRIGTDNISARRFKAERNRAVRRSRSYHGFDRVTAARSLDEASEDTPEDTFDAAEVHRALGSMFEVEELIETEDEDGLFSGIAVDEVRFHKILERMTHEARIDFERKKREEAEAYARRAQAMEQVRARTEQARSNLKMENVLEDDELDDIAQEAVAITDSMRDGGYYPSSPDSRIDRWFEHQPLPSACSDVMVR